MIITHKLNLDLAHRGVIPRLDAMQNDANSRALEITILENGTPWEIPANATAALNYIKPDGTTGLYDTLPDGRSAYTISGSTVSIFLAPQVLTVPGLVQVSVILTRDTVQITTFPLSIHVGAAPGNEAEKSENYYHYTTFEALNYAIGNLESLKTEDKSSLVAAVNEVVQTETGNVKSVNGMEPDENGNIEIVAGFSPTVKVKETTEGVHVYVTDRNGTNEAFIPNGQDGYTPRKDVDYFDGKPGENGVSPIIKTQQTADGIVINIHDVNGHTAVTVPKGQDGVTPVKGVDYWSNADKAEMVADVKEALESDEIPIYTMEGGYYDTTGGLQQDTGVWCKHTDLISVKPGDRFLYSGRGRYSVPSVLWYDSNQIVISFEQYFVEATNGNMKNVTVAAPVGSSYARFCSYNNTGYDILFEISRLETPAQTSPLYGKKIVYDGNSICYGAGYKGGYAKLIAEKVMGTYDNQAVGGGRLRTLAGSTDSFHSIVDNLPNLPTDGDLYCFEGGINDYWTKGVLGTFDYDNFDGELDTTTVCGALETIFRYCLNNFVGKPVCFVITHKIQKTAYKENSNGDSFKDYHDAMVGICEKYSIPYYDAFNNSGLNGWNTAQNNAFLTGNSAGEPDGCHPNEEGYKRYYVPQLIALFESMMPEDVTEPEVPAEPTYTNVLDEAGHKAGVYLSNGNEGTDANAFTTGYIPIENRGTVYLKNVRMPDESSHGNRVAFYKADKSFYNQVSVTSSLNGWNTVFDSDGNLIQFTFDLTDVSYMRISAWQIDDTSIITVNEPI